MNEFMKEPKKGQDAWDIWMSRIRTTLQWRKDNYDTEWQRSYDLYEGDHWRDTDINDNPRSDEVRSRVTINKVNSTINNLIPFVLNDDAIFHGNPRKPDSTVITKLQQDIVNYEYKQQEMQIEIEKAAYDWAIIGHGIVKTGYTIEIDEARTKADGEINYDDYIKSDNPYTERIDPFLFLIDPTAKRYNLGTARWVAEIYFKHIPDILANKNYDQSVINKIKNHEYGITTKSTLFGAQADGSYLKDLKEVRNPESELGVMYEIWDKKFKQVLVFADGVPEPLVVKDIPYDYLDGSFPYIKVDYIYVPNDLYGIGLCLLLEDIQFENNRRRTYALNHARRFNRKYQILKNSLDANQEQKLVDGDDGTVIVVNTLPAVIPIDDAPISQDYRLIEGLLDRDFQEMAGLDQLFRGGNLPSRTTGVEVNARTNIMALKLDGRVKSFNKFILRIINQISAHISAYYTTEKVRRVLGEQAEEWQNYSSEDIKDQIDWEMESVSAPQTDPITERQQKLQIFQIVMNPLTLQLIQTGLMRVDLNALFKWLLESFNLKDVGRFFNDSLIPNVPLTQVPTQPEGSEGSQLPITQPVAENMQGNITGSELNNQSGLQV